MCPLVFCMKLLNIQLHPMCEREFGYLYNGTISQIQHTLLVQTVCILFTIRGLPEHLLLPKNWITSGFSERSPSGKKQRQVKPPCLTPENPATDEAAAELDMGIWLHWSAPVWNEVFRCVNVRLESFWGKSLRVCVLPVCKDLLGLSCHHSWVLCMSMGMCARRRLEGHGAERTFIEDLTVSTLDVGLESCNISEDHATLCATVGRNERHGEKKCLVKAGFHSLESFWIIKFSKLGKTTIHFKQVKWGREREREGGDFSMM